MLLLARLPLPGLVAALLSLLFLVLPLREAALRVIIPPKTAPLLLELDAPDCIDEIEEVVSCGE